MKAFLDKFNEWQQLHSDLASSGLPAFDESVTVSELWRNLHKQFAKELKDTMALILPIPMILICPNCNNQHLDGEDERVGWTNPPHKSHLCKYCGCIWRPCDYETTGVQSITTRGERDTVELNTFATARAFSMQEAADFKFLNPGDVVEVVIKPGQIARFRLLLGGRKERRS